jgi:regulatory protein
VSDVITSITTSPRDTRLMTVKVGNRAVATLPVRVIEELNLGLGEMWDDALAARVHDAVAFQRAFEAAMKKVNRTALSRRRMAEKLKLGGIEEAMIDRVLDRLVEIGAVDDEAYGRALVNEIQARKPAGPALLRAKLRQKGLENKLIDKLLAEVKEDPTADPVGDAAELARKKLRSMARLEPQVRKRRLWGALARRGFDGDTIDAALRQLKELRELSD